MLQVLESRESGGRLNYCHTFSIALGTQVKRKWRTSIIILLPMLWVLKSRESGGRLNYYHTFLLLWVLKSRESGGRLNYYHTCSIALGTEVKRKWRTSQLLSYLFYCFGYSNHEKVKDVSNITIFFLMLWALK